MAPNNDRVVIINGKRFRDVTNQTVSGPVYSYEEAKQIACHGHVYYTTNRG